jgi:hypothetical protein
MIFLLAATGLALYAHMLQRKAHRAPVAEAVHVAAAPISIKSARQKRRVRH